MNKNYVLVLLFNEKKNKILLVKRNKEPFNDCWNAIGGRVEENETIEEAAKRECFEEVEVRINNPKLLVTCIYPEDNLVNSNTHLNVMYDFITEVDAKDNDEGHYEWKSLKFVMDINNKTIAGFSNLNQFVKEILDQENIKKFYE